MDLKNFFKPTIWKIAAFIAAFIINTLILYIFMCIPVGGSVAQGSSCKEFSLEGLLMAHPTLLLTALNAQNTDALRFYAQVMITFVIMPLIIVYAIICAIAYAVGIVKQRLTTGKAQAKKKKE